MSDSFDKTIDPEAPKSAETTADESVVTAAATPQAVAPKEDEVSVADEAIEMPAAEVTEGLAAEAAEATEATVDRAAADAADATADAAAAADAAEAADATANATADAAADADTAGDATATASDAAFDAPADGADAAPGEDDEAFVPDEDEVQAELQRERTRTNFYRTLRSTIFSLIVVAAVAVIIAMLVLPVMQIQGTSMTNTLQDQDIVVALRGSKYQTGDVIAFYYNNNILIKRVIAGTGQWVNITDDGTVYVDNVRLDEPYITDKSLGDCNIQLPYQVPDGKIFVMGDHRSTSLDSRNTALGCVSTDMVVGRLLLRAWPPNTFGPIQ